jgi:4-hydroxy-2-oxoheptanedioate aldolase
MTVPEAPYETLAEELRRGSRLIGLIVKMPAPATVEMAGLGGFDFVVIDMEHGLGDGSELQHHLRAADSVRVATLVRVSGPASPEILRALDAGADGIIVPHVACRAEVEQAVAAARYPPEGGRSLALSTRSGRYGRRSVVEHLAEARRRTLVVVQIEDDVAVQRAEEISSVAGLDAVFIGPTDLSASLGVAGQLEHAVVVDAVERIQAAVLAEGRIALCTIARDEDEAAGWFGRGARMVLFESSVLLATRLRALAAACHQDGTIRSTSARSDGQASPSE